MGLGLQLVLLIEIRLNISNIIIYKSYNQIYYRSFIAISKASELPAPASAHKPICLLFDQNDKYFS
jgi:hypothetical protein